MSQSKPPYAEISVLSTLALKGALESAAPGLRAEYHATQALLKSIAEGAAADVVILTKEGIDQLVAQGAVLPETRLELGRSGVGMAVRAGAPKPDISSFEALKRTLVSAESVGHSKQGASGLYFAGLLEKHGLANKLKKRVIVEKGPGRRRHREGRDPARRAAPLRARAGRGHRHHRAAARRKCRPTTRSPPQS